MSSLENLLPVPLQTTSDRGNIERRKSMYFSGKSVVSTGTAPPYGRRKSWLPRALEDFGDGGAFPEIHFAQYPLGLGSKKVKNNSNAVPVQLDAEGSIKYDALIQQGHRKRRIVYHKFHDLLPTEVTSENDPDLQKPSEEEIKDITEATRLALEKITNSKISAAMPGKAVEKPSPTQLVRYTPSQQGAVFNSGAKQRIVRVTDIQKDPMDPLHFKINKKIPPGPPSPPVPVLQSPPRKFTVQQRKDWKIPPCISNWKNPHGLTVPLDMRIVADDARGLEKKHFYGRRDIVSEALCLADRKLRQGVELRAQVKKKVVQKEKEKKEEQLRQLAQKAREERAGIKSAALEENEARGRDVLRHERHKDRQRERNLGRAAQFEKRQGRDITEQIALGLPNPRHDTSDEIQFDQRLFNQTKGIDSGFGAEDDYNIYDKEWRSHEIANWALFNKRPNQDKDAHGEDLDKKIRTPRFVSHKEFSGADRSIQRNGPVQFEKVDDLLGVQQLFQKAKNTKKRPADEGNRENNQVKKRKL